LTKTPFFLNPKNKKRLYLDWQSRFSFAIPKELLDIKNFLPTAG